MTPRITEVERLPAFASGRGPGVPEPQRQSDPRTAVVVLIDAVAAFVAVRVAGGTALTAVAFLAGVLGANLFDRNRPRRLAPSALDDSLGLAARGVVVAALTVAIGLPLAGDDPGRVPAAGVVVAASAYALLATAGRALAYDVIRRANARGRLARSVVIVGTSAVGARIARDMLDHPEHGLRPVGFVDVAQPGRPERLCVPVVGDVADLPKIAAEERVHDIVVTFGEMRDDELVEVLRACDRLGCEIHVVPRLFELGFDESGLSQLWGTQLLRLRRGPFRTRVWALKRALDVTLAAAALVLAGPLMLVLALLLRLELGPGVLFRQKRTGIDGRPFELVKFRTLSPVPDGATSEWSVANVDRMGPVGHFLRRSSLDELPQLWNVVKGQMSLVGPRPEQPQYVTQFAREYHRYHARLRLPAGVTGWAQIHDLRGATSLEDRVRFDNYYIENWSLWWDLKILFRTVLAVLRMRGG